MLKPMTAPPKGFTGVRAHKLKQAEGIQCIIVMYATRVVALHVVSLGGAHNEKFSSTRIVICQVMIGGFSSCDESILASAS